MIQDIDPYRLDNSFVPQAPRADDSVLLFDSDGRLLVRAENGKIRFTVRDELSADSTVYLFSIGSGSSSQRSQHIICGDGTRTTACAGAAGAQTAAILRSGRCCAHAAGM